MTTNLLQLKIKERLNKIASLDYDNIECWQVAEAFNKAQIEWVRRQVHGTNQTKEGDESTKMSIDDLQSLITELSIGTTKHANYYETNSLPANYLFYKRVSVDCKTDCCPNRHMIVYLAQVADVDNLLIDNFRQPSATWGETFCTMQNNKIRIYTNGEFEIVNPVINYYRKPVDIQFANCMNPNTGVLYTTNVECEFKDDITEILVDEACSILAGDIESSMQFQREKQNATINT